MARGKIVAVKTEGVERGLSISKEQVELLLKLDAEVARARASFDLAYSAIVFGHGLSEARLLRLDTDKNLLFVEVPPS